MNVYTYRCEAGHTFEVAQRMSDDRLAEHPGCGAACFQIVNKVPAVRINRTLQVAEYREDLARFPGDPLAFVDGPRALQRAIDANLREGAVLRSPSDAKTFKAPNYSEGNLAGEAYEAAKADGFRLDSEKESDE